MILIKSKVTKGMPRQVPHLLPPLSAVRLHFQTDPAITADRVVRRALMFALALLVGLGAAAGVWHYMTPRLRRAMQARRAQAHLAAAEEGRGQSPAADAALASVAAAAGDLAKETEMAALLGSRGEAGPADSTAAAAEDEKEEAGGPPLTATGEAVADGGVLRGPPEGSGRAPESGKVGLSGDPLLDEEAVLRWFKGIPVLGGMLANRERRDRRGHVPCPSCFPGPLGRLWWQILSPL